MLSLFKYGIIIVIYLKYCIKIQFLAEFSVLLQLAYILLPRLVAFTIVFPFIITHRAKETSKQDAVYFILSLSGTSNGPCKRRPLP